MDPLSIFGLFVGLGGGIGSLLNLGAANSQANATTAEETQLLNEAHQAQQQQEAEPGLIATRNSEEVAISGPTDKWTGTDTILGDVKMQNPQPTETKTMAPATTLGV